MVFSLNHILLFFPTLPPFPFFPALFYLQHPHHGNSLMKFRNTFGLQADVSIFTGQN